MLTSFYKAHCSRQTVRVLGRAPWGGTGLGVAGGRDSGTSTTGVEQAWVRLGVGTLGQALQGWNRPGYGWG